MENVYLLISFLQILLTIWIISILIKIDTKIISINDGFENGFKNFYKHFHVIKSVLSVMPKAFKFSKKFNKIKILKKIITFVLSIYYLKNKPKNFISFFKKYLF